ncbi:DUF3017 domain-containing protein [Demequina capsici]|uniref:DUF3017 domain-containing protein n=1 Tax=Demequina capsici TaxID=3075620 RepID=A0AA96F567_9MICO|nr:MULTISPECIES: DUF3017 domain-containing protein [unclassified Demequina]WNM23964.1 DUF3017 domain-containing protein [Demequina sp. OYTSA14]WNM26792.1 DUF3017 domain-containing protein [Demequina sp. PMTSA13]
MSQVPDTPQTSEPVAVATLIGMAVAVALALVVGPRLAVLLMAAACVAGAVARVVLPVDRAFSVRRRAIDVGMMVAFAAGLTFLGLTAPLG